MDKIVDTSVSGYDACLIALPFDQGKDLFNDHRHAQNFVKYLFSQSRAHPQNDQTQRNFITEFDENGGVASRRYNLTPSTLQSDFAHRRLPKSDAHRDFWNDGAYPMFMVRLPDGRALSNFIKRDEGSEECSISHPFLGYLGQIGVSDSDLTDLALKHAKKGPILSFEESTDKHLIWIVEACVHRLLQSAMGYADKVVLAATHRDQADHNPVYHIHRLLRH